MVLAIITVVKDDPEGLEFTLSSFYQQSQHSRIIVVDGGSRNPTHDVIQQWRRQLSLEVDSALDLGPYDAMNRGLSRLDSSDRVWFINAGDALHGGHALVRAQNLTDGHDFNWGFGPHQVIEVSGLPRRVIRGQPYSQENFAYGRTPICHQAVIARVSCLRRIGGFDLTYPIAADYKSILLLGQRWKPVQWDDVLVRYRAGGISDRHLVRTIREQGQLRRGILAPRGIALLEDRAYDARRHTRHLARVALDGIGISRRHFEPFLRRRSEARMDKQA